MTESITTKKLEIIYSKSLEEHKFCTICSRPMSTSFRRFPIADAFAYITCSNSTRHDFKVVAQLTGPIFDVKIGNKIDRDWVEI